ncbi:MAG TPA: TlpA disulfide reductase family protein [Nevskiaceae bacterium]|nr:TlpA disulfide reductase family protein [Nevskiaceae bacterium]
MERTTRWCEGWRTRTRAALLAVVACLPLCAHAVKAGHPAPPLAGTSIHGGAPISLSQFRGKVVYVDFWATWCGPCRTSLPMLSELRQQLGAQGFEILGVNLDRDRQAALRAMSDAGVAYPVVTGVPESTLKAFELGGMPVAYLVDRQGRVHSVHTGFRAAEFDDLRKQIESLLGDKGT